MKRRDFIQLTGLSAGAMMMPFTSFGDSVDVSRLLDPLLDSAQKKQLADVALNTTKGLGATYTDVRIGRYLNQFVVTREDKVQNIVNTESYGMGIRVIANGGWGFAAIDKLDNDSIAKAAELAVAIAKENSRLLSEPVRLAHSLGDDDVAHHITSAKTRSVCLK